MHYVGLMPLGKWETVAAKPWLAPSDQVLEIHPPDRLLGAAWAGADLRGLPEKADSAILSRRRGNPSRRLWKRSLVQAAVIGIEYGGGFRHDRRAASTSPAIFKAVRAFSAAVGSRP
jgi:hypothetical protein